MTTGKKLNTEPPGDLDALRERIDAIDAELHALLMERADVVGKIAKAKKAGSELAYRPAREASVLRRILANHEGPLPKRDLVEIWQTLMSVYLRLQGPVSLAVFDGPRDGRYLDTAIDKFGHDLAVRTYANASQVVDAVSSGGADIGVLPVPAEFEAEPWWPILLLNDAPRARIIAQLPTLRDKAEDVEPVYVIADGNAEASGDDVSLIGVETTEDVDPDSLADMLKVAGLEAVSVYSWQDADTSHWLRLLRIEEFVTDDDDRLSVLRDNLGETGKGVVLLGGYPRGLRAKDIGED